MGLAWRIGSHGDGGSPESKCRLANLHTMSTGVFKMGGTLQGTLQNFRVGQPGCPFGVGVVLENYPVGIWGRWPCLGGYRVPAWVDKPQELSLIHI